MADGATLPWEGPQAAGALPWENTQPDVLQKSDQAIQSSVHNILSMFGHQATSLGSAVKSGAIGGFGSEPIATPATALSPETEATMNRFGINQTTLPGAVLGEAVRGAAAAAEFAGRATSAVVGGAVEAGGQALENAGVIDKGQAKGSGAEAATDPEIQRLMFGIPELGKPDYNGDFETALARARAKGVIGPGGEAAHYDAVPVPPEEVVAREKAAAAAGIPVPPTVKAPATIHELAAKIEPEAVAQFHDLEDQKTAHTQTLKDLGDARESSPEAADAAARVKEILSKVNGVEERLTQAQKARLDVAQADLDAALHKDTPAMAAVRAARQEADFAQRDLVPTVASAYQQARAMAPEIKPGVTGPRSAVSLLDEHEQMMSGNFNDAAKAAAQPKDVRTDAERAAKEQQRQDYIAKKAEADKAVATEKTAQVEGAEEPAKKPANVGPGGPLKPVEGTGDLKTRGVSEGVEALAIENGLTEGLGDLPEYHQLSMAEQAASSVAYMNKDYDAAKEVAMGRKAPPKGVLPESIFVAVEKRANAEGDIDLITDLANTKLATQATTMGQRIRTYAERDKTSTTGAIQEVQAAREASLNAKGELDAAKKDVVGDIRSEIKKSATPNPWEGFIKGITCG